MPIAFKANGPADATFPLSVDYPADGASNDLNVLTVMFGSTNGSQLVNTPSGWTAGPAKYYGTGWGVTIQKFFRVGNFSGSSVSLTFAGSPTVTNGVAIISSFTCDGGKTWDLKAAWTYGYDSTIDVFQHAWSQYQGSFPGPPSGRLDPTAGDYFICDSLFGGRSGGYCCPDYQMGAGVTGGTGTVINWAYSTNETFTMFQAGREVASVSPPFGNPFLYWGTAVNGAGVAMHTRLTVNERSSADTRPAVGEFIGLGGIVGSDTSTSVESSNQPITSNQKPQPRRWTNGEIPTATLLNKEWKDTLVWLIGTTKPAFSGGSTNTSDWTVSSWHSIPINVEYKKQGGMIHTTNSAVITVPEDGWYEGCLFCSVDATGASTSTKEHAGIKINGGAGYVARTKEKHASIALRTFNASFYIYLTAGDTVEFAVFSTAASTTVQNWVSLPDGAEPRIEIWWSAK